MAKTRRAQFIQEAEEAFRRAKELLAVAEAHDFGSSPLTITACSMAARDEIALGTLAARIAEIKMIEAGQQS